MRNRFGENNSNFKHGMRGTRIYSIWAGMKKRCDNPKSVGYENYGGRGIGYDPQWKDFRQFLRDMEGGYSDEMTLDRIDVNGDYCKENCKWSNIPEQARNHRKRKDNRSGLTGVHRQLKLNSSGNVIPCWAATWKEDGRVRSKTFSVRKYGEKLARSMAEMAREEAIKRLHSKGIVYADSHGI